MRNLLAFGLVAAVVATGLASQPVTAETGHNPLPPEVAPLAFLNLDGVGARPRTLAYGDLTVSAKVEMTSSRAICGTDRMPCAALVAKIQRVDSPAFMIWGAKSSLNSITLGGAVTIRWLDRGASDPQVVLSSWTGDMQCCKETDIATRDSAGAWHLVKAPLQEYDSDFRFVDLARDGDAELVGRDGSFICAFSSCAASWLPIQIFRVDGLRLVNVSRAPYARQVVLHDLSVKEAWNAEHPGNPEPDGYIAGWAAEESLLGRISSAWPVVVAGHHESSSSLPSPMSKCRVAKSVWPRNELGFPECPTGDEYTIPFPRALAGFLVAHGYLTAQQGRAFGYDAAAQKSRAAETTAAYRAQQAHAWYLITRAYTCEPAVAPMSSPAAFIRGDRSLGTEDDVEVLKQGDDGEPTVVQVDEPQGGGIYVMLTFARGLAACEGWVRSQNAVLRSLQ